MAEVEIYTDGACRGNPGPGGWAAILSSRGHRREIHGAEARTTNNRMELMAAIKGLEALKRPCRVSLYTDSEYLMKGVTEWLANWKRRNWRTSARKEVRNRDLWERLDALSSKHDIRWQWVRGHAGNAGNEAADRLANRAIDELAGDGPAG